MFLSLIVVLTRDPNEIFATRSCIKPTGAECSMCLTIIYKYLYVHAYNVQLGSIDDVINAIKCICIYVGVICKHLPLCEMAVCILELLQLHPVARFFFYICEFLIWDNFLSKINFLSFSETPPPASSEQSQRNSHWAARTTMINAITHEEFNSNTRARPTIN